MIIVSNFYVFRLRRIFIDYTTVTHDDIRNAGLRFFLYKSNNSYKNRPCECCTELCNFLNKNMN